MRDSFFYLKLRMHCGAVHQPDFKTECLGKQRGQRRGEREVDGSIAEQSEHTRHLRLGCIPLQLECVPSEIQVANEMVIHKTVKGHLGLEGL